MTSREILKQANYSGKRTAQELSGYSAMGPTCSSCSHGEQSSNPDRICCSWHGHTRVAVLGRCDDWERRPA